jgi:hypothetical protein
VKIQCADNPNLGDRPLRAVNTMGCRLAHPPSVRAVVTYHESNTPLLSALSHRM